MNYLKRKIFEKFFRYEAYVIRRHKKEMNDLISNNYSLDKINKEYKIYHENLIDTCKRYDMILGLEKNNINETFIVASNSDDSQIDIYLISPYNFRVKPYLQSILHTNFSTGERYLELTDVQSINNSIGNGDIMMKYFINEARRCKVKYIYGMLSEVDKDNFCRSIPYYKKYGYEITLNNEKEKGSIKLFL